MTITTEKQKEEFRPLTIAITLETFEEFEAIDEMTKLDLSIPEMVLEETGIKASLMITQQFLHGMSMQTQAHKKTFSNG